MRRHEVLGNFEAYSLNMISNLVKKAVIQGYTEFKIERYKLKTEKSINTDFDLIIFEVQILAKK